MINREFISAFVLTYTNDLDEYGVPRTGEPKTDYIEVTKPRLYNHSPVEDVRFQGVTDTCFTKSKDISDANELVIENDKNYLIKFANTEGRLTQLFLVCK